MYIVHAYINSGVISIMQLAEDDFYVFLYLIFSVFYSHLAFLELLLKTSFQHFSISRKSFNSAKFLAHQNNGHFGIVNDILYSVYVSVA